MVEGSGNLLAHFCIIHLEKFNLCFAMARFTVLSVLGLMMLMRMARIRFRSMGTATLIRQHSGILLALTTT